MKSACVFLSTLWLCNLSPSAAEGGATEARVTIQGDLSYVRCICPLDLDSSYPAIINEIDYCESRDGGFLACDDAILSCNGLMQCWTPSDSWMCPAPCPWSVTTDGLVSGVSSTGSGGDVHCSTNGGEQKCDVSSSASHFIGNDVNLMVEYCNQLRQDEGVRCSSPFYVRSSNGTITEVIPYEGTATGDDNTANPDVSTPQKVSEDVTGSTSSLLPRCGDTGPSDGNDDYWITPVGTNCAKLLFSVDFRTIGGGLLTYSTDVKDTDTCDSSYELKSQIGGDSGDCKSYYVSQGVACLSSCYHKYDCYISQEEVALNVASCASAAGVEEEPAPSNTPNDEEEVGDSKDETGNLCYDYNYSKGPFREDPPEQRRCDSLCASYEVVQFEDITISIGGCTSGIANFCDSVKEGSGEVTKCVECTGDLCNPIYSYNGNSGSKAGFASGIIAIAALFVPWY